MRGSYPSTTRKCCARSRMLYFLTTLRSSVAWATRSRSGDGPMMVPASSRMTQSFLAAGRLSSEDTHVAPRVVAVRAHNEDSNLGGGVNPAIVWLAPAALAKLSLPKTLSI